MVIACKKCHTRFHLDDARVPPTGVRVRCSRCKHAFFVEPPGGREQALHAAAAEAAAAGSAPAPPPDEDLAERPAARAPKPAPKPRREAEAPARSEPARPAARAPVPAPPAPQKEEAAAEEEESDWEFNLEEPEWGDAPEAPAKPAAPPAAAAADFDLSDASDASDATVGMELGSDEDPAADARDELFDAAGGNLDAEPESPADGEAEVPQPPASAQDSPSELDELGSPDTWDFLADREAPGAPAGPASRAPERAAREASAATPEAPAAPRVAAREAPALSRTLQWAAWVWVLACAALGLVATLSPPARVAARSAEPVTVGALRLEDVRARVLENVHAGPVWVVSGRLRNPGGAVGRTDPLRVEVLDAKGSVVGTAWLGALDDPARLREEPPRDLAAELARSWPEAGVAPGGAQELHAVLSPVAPDAARWRIAVP